MKAIFQTLEAIKEKLQVVDGQLLECEDSANRMLNKNPDPSREAEAEMIKSLSKISSSRAAQKSLIKLYSPPLLVGQLVPV